VRGVTRSTVSSERVSGQPGRVAGDARRVGLDARSGSLAPRPAPNADLFVALVLQSAPIAVARREPP
jgi:hypothetical protein